LDKKNPAPDKYKDPHVWTFMGGEANNPGSYEKLGHFVSPLQVAERCPSVHDFYEWKKGRNTIFDTPGDFYNAGPAIEEGQTECAPHAAFPAKTFFMAPEFGGKGHAAIVRWKSPITGLVTVAGSVQCVDSFVTGVTWELKQGVTTLFGPTENTGDSLMSFGPMEIRVVRGEALNLAVGLGKSSHGAYDSTAVNLTITSS
jgi:hypothetical protein